MKSFKLNLREANSMWNLINSKNTFYMLVLASKTYIPEIKGYCGNLIEIEHLNNQLGKETKAFTPSISLSQRINYE